MPQLIPFYFINQLSFSFLSLLALIYIFSKYILPLFTYQQVIRMYITKLSNKSYQFQVPSSNCVQLFIFLVLFYPPTSYLDCFLFVGMGTNGGVPRPKTDHQATLTGENSNLTLWLLVTVLSELTLSVRGGTQTRLQSRKNSVILVRFSDLMVGRAYQVFYGGPNFLLHLTCIFSCNY